MKKKTTTILCVACLIFGILSIQEVRAQYQKKRPKSARFKTPYSFGKAQHTNGMKGMEIGLGAGKNGFTTQVGFHYFLSNKWQTELTAQFEKGDLSGVEFQSYYLELGSSYTFFHLNDKFYFNGLSGASAVWDDLPNATEKSLNAADKNVEMGLGIFLGLSSEWFFHHHWALTVKCQQHFYFNNTFGHQRFFARSGLKFSF
ncbi:hypothetical protein [Flexithrix dorotheae]|uniref:hypothetical protein n=1 Tax=Flexithrix dorotheae TaxID=70993 RepID=UPI000365CA3B|nr:hypothetical protein [Flexithrix dorotheae]